MNQINNQKLRVVTRRDLKYGVSATQACHAAIDFQHQFQTEAKQWQTKSNYLALLTVSDEEALVKLINKAEMSGIKFTLFCEPDLNNEITAVAFEPSDKARKLTSSCPLLGKEMCHV